MMKGKSGRCYSVFRISSAPVCAALAGAAVVASSLGLSVAAHGQDLGAEGDLYPTNSSFGSYHSAPRWRESEAHPLRVLAYVVHPFGWAARELIFRPLSYFASSTEVTRSVSGYREAGDWHNPSCFSKNSDDTRCRSLPPFNYERTEEASTEEGSLNDEPKGGEVFFPSVLFGFGDSSLTSDGRARVKEIAGTLADKGSVRVILEGHTDDVGSEAFNQKLGLDRALAVQAELVSLGVSSDRLSSVSFGETKPVDPAKTKEARARNRRVEVEVAQ
jgi:outer membrane protein OmpA-like peptidoglycan-associated protein